MAAENSALRRILAAAGSMSPACRETSDANALAALAAAAGQDRAARARPHPQPKAMGLRPAPVVRLKSTLGHEKLQVRLIRRQTLMCRSHSAARLYSGN